MQEDVIWTRKKVSRKVTRVLGREETVTEEGKQ